MERYSRDSGRGESRMVARCAAREIMLSASGPSLENVNTRIAPFTHNRLVIQSYVESQSYDYTFEQHHIQVCLIALCSRRLSVMRPQDKLLYRHKNYRYEVFGLLLEFC
jgi:hypothetical protein